MKRRHHHHVHNELRQRLRQEQLATCKNRGLARVIEKNIDAIAGLKERSIQRLSLQDRLADLMTRFSGSMLFVYLHAIWFAVWITVNLGWFGFTPFDAYPFGLLTLIVSLEAIFLSTFVLVSQNRQAALADQRADLDLQINLLAEYEITRILILTDRIADCLQVEKDDVSEISELEEDVPPEALMDRLDSAAATPSLQKKSQESK